MLLYNCNFHDMNKSRGDNLVALNYSITNCTLINHRKTHKTHNCNSDAHTF
jgi:hypothetical protein